MSSHLHRFGSPLGIGDGGVTRLSSLLLRHNNLTVVDLGSQQIADDGCVALMKALGRHVGLRNLHLEDNHIGDRGCSAVAAAVRGGSKRSKGGGGGGGLARLTHVDLSYNKIGDAGARALTCAIEHATMLEVLHVHANAIGDEAVAELHAALLRCCPSLDHVSQFSMESSQERWPFHKAQP